MAVQEYIKTAAQNLMQAAMHLRDQARSENSDIDRQINDMNHHINLAQQEEAGLRATQSTTSDQNLQNSMNVQISNLGNEVNRRKQEIGNLQNTQSQRLQAMEAMASQLEQMSHQVELFAARPEAQ